MILTIYPLRRVTTVHTLDWVLIYLRPGVIWTQRSPEHSGGWKYSHGTVTNCGKINVDKSQDATRCPPRSHGHSIATCPVIIGLLTTREGVGFLTLPGLDVPCLSLVTHGFVWGWHLPTEGRGSGLLRWPASEGCYKIILWRLIWVRMNELHSFNGQSKSISLRECYTLAWNPNAAFIQINRLGLRYFCRI